jgi:hypothetical protein
VAVDRRVDFTQQVVIDNHVETARKNPRPEKLSIGR